MNWIFTYSQRSPFMPQEVLTKIPEHALALPPPGHAHSELTIALDDFQIACQLDCFPNLK